jgi:hypothetical protein
MELQQLTIDLESSRYMTELQRLSEVLLLIWNINVLKNATSVY